MGAKREVAEGTVQPHSHQAAVAGPGELTVHTVESSSLTAGGQRHVPDGHRNPGRNMHSNYFHSNNLHTEYLCNVLRYLFPVRILRTRHTTAAGVLRPKG